MSQEILKEHSPLTGNNTIAIFERNKQSFTFPIHVHDVFELNFVENAENALRIVGSSMEKIADKDLVLICNPTLSHAWKDGSCRSENIHEITIQFSPHGFSSLFERPHFTSIEVLFQKAFYGIAFSQKAIEKALPFLRTLTVETDDFYLEIKFFMLMYELSRDTECRQLTTDLGDNREDVNMDKMHSYLKRNVSNQIIIKDIASYMGMSTATFFRYVKNNTGMNFSSYLLEWRLNAILRELNESDKKVSIEYYAERYGFSIPYLYKTFKSRTGMTMIEYQKSRKEKLIRRI